MPPDMAISMRHTKLKAEEAALLAGEISKPSWESRNEGIHERVSFEDSIWGFDLAGGIFYQTPLRVTFVKPDSRAEKAGIRPGDKLLRINDLDTSTLTIQQAHDIIIESGIHLKLSVTSPEDEEDSYYCYEDPLIDGYDSEEERRIEEEKAKKRRVCARVSHFWSLQWPWVSKRRFIYRESNCFMVPSKYEDARRDKYPPLPSLRYTDDIVHFHKDGVPEDQDNTKRIPSLWEVKQQARKERKERLAKAAAMGNGSGETNGTGDTNGTGETNRAGEANEPDSDMTDDEEPVKEVRQKSNKNRRSTLKVERQETIDESEEKEESPRNEEEEIENINEDLNGEKNEAMNGEQDEEINVEQNEDMKEDINEEQNEKTDNELAGSNNEEDETAKPEAENDTDVPNDIIIPVPEIKKENNHPDEESAEVEDDNVEVNGEVNDDDVLNEVLGKTGDSASRNEEDNNILDSILSDDGQNLESSESNNER